MTRQLDGARYLELLRGGAANLRENVKIVNELNVFPIPDGDTGENMRLTVEGGVAAAEGCGSNAISTVAQSAARGMLLSARGNSGVIISQFFAGIARGLEGMETADVPSLGFAFRSGVRRAYDAVMNPTEGTILTVAREAVAFACGRINGDSTMESFFGDCLQEMHASLRRTPELLAVLKEAGVIDSGGAGLVYIIEGMNRTLRGEPMAHTAPAEAAPDFSGFDENSQMEYGYCTEYLLQLQRCKGGLGSFSLEAYRQRLSAMGDSIVALQNGSVVKTHIHTLHPGPILEYCQQYGEFLTLKIENMTLQHNESIIRNGFPADTPPAEAQRKPFATVAVAMGSGVQQALRSLGADVVLEGGQGRNPSPEQFMAAFDTANADTLFVLPNNGNIILAARQAGELYTKSRVIVVESRDIGGCYAALSMLDYDLGSPEAIAQSMRDAMEGVRTGLVTRAVRDASLSGVDIRRGDSIGFCGKDMLIASDDTVTTAVGLLKKLDAAKHEIIIGIYGDTLSPGEKEALCRNVHGDFPGAEFYTLDGGQHGYDLQLIIE